MPHQDGHALRALAIANGDANISGRAFEEARASIRPILPDTVDPPCQCLDRFPINLIARERKTQQQKEPIRYQPRVLAVRFVCCGHRLSARQPVERDIEIEHIHTRLSKQAE